ncbi:MAG: hypothetical protein WC608_00580 [Parcubacteria group bacterium]
MNFLNGNQKDNKLSEYSEMRPVDELAQKTYSWWGKAFVFIKKTKIKTWQGVFLLAFITGIIIAFIWTASLNIK